MIYFTPVNDDEIQGRWKRWKLHRTTHGKNCRHLMMTLALILTLLPAALAVDLNVDVGFYFKAEPGRHLHAPPPP